MSLEINRKMENKKESLVILALQQRIGELVANYETQIAFLRAEITEMISKNEAKSEAIDEFSNEIRQLSKGVSNG